MRKIKQQILLVEDEAIVAIMESRVLTSEGYLVDWASSGEKAISLFGNGGIYDLVVSDVDLGSGIDGIEAARRMMAIQPVPLLILSTYDQQYVDSRAEGLGRYGFISKGTDSGILLEAVARALSPSQGETPPKLLSRMDTLERHEEIHLTL
jgi:CheY-like chemotaxis protein